MATGAANTYEHELNCALEAARSVGDRLREAFHGGFRVDIDQQIDQAIHERLTAAFPRYGYRSEELGLTTRPQDQGKHLWLVDPQDGTSAAKRGFRGAAVSVALLRNGVPVLGVVHAYCAPDDDADTFWWCAGLPNVFRNGRAIARIWPKEPSGAHTALVSQDADRNTDANADLAAPMRYRTVPGIAYRLALVAGGEADVAVTLNQPVGWDMAGGHALLMGAGGDLYDANGQPITYDEAGSIKNSSVSAFFGGHLALIEPLVRREWSRVLQVGAKGSPADHLCYLVPGNTVPRADVLSRAQGCLLGQLAGDALGSLVEFKSAAAIDRRYPDGPRLLEDGGAWSTIAGQPTDDSELALAMARSIVQVGDYDPDAVAAAYAKWYESGPFDIGGTTTQALSAASGAVHNGVAPAFIANAAADHDSQANGALMRVSPLGIFDAGYDPSRGFFLGQMDASLTHPNPVCRDASGLVAAVIAGAIRSGYGTKGLYEFALEVAEQHRVVDPVKEVLRAASKEPPRDFSLQQGWVLIALQNAFYQLLHAESMEAGIVATVRYGGDTDTNAAIAGSLLGAVHGRNAVPMQWLDRVITCRPLAGNPNIKNARPPVYWPVDAFALAERLLLAGRQARQAGWRIYPLPPARLKLPFTRTFSGDEFARLKAGFPPDWDAHWGISYREPWLYFCRSWTGFCIFRVRLEAIHSGASVAEAWVSRDQIQYGCTDVDEDKRMLNYLIDNLLLRSSS